MIFCVFLGVGLAAEADWKAIHTEQMTVYWLPEAAATLGGAAVWALVLEPAEPRVSGEAWVPHGLDGRIEPQWSPRAATISDFLAIPTDNYGLNVPVLATLGVGVWGGVVEKDWRAGAADSLVLVETVVTTAVISDLSKNAIARPRPYTAQRFADAYPDVAADPDFQEEFTEEGHFDAFKSMPSGHTSVATAVGTSAATMIWLREREHQDRRWVGALAYGGAAALGAGTGVARVVAGKHHPTDTMAGFALGAAVGLGVPLLHTLGGEATVSVGPGGLGVSGSW